MKIETNFLGKNQATKLGIELNLFSGNSQIRSLLRHEATSSPNLKFFIIFFLMLTILFLITVKIFFDTIFFTLLRHH